MPDININVNMGTVGGGNFQQLIDSINKLDASFQKVGEAGKTAGKATKDSFAESMAIMSQYGNNVKLVGAKINGLKTDILAQNDALRRGTIDTTKHSAEVTRLNSQLRQLQQAQRQYNSLLGQTNAQAKTLTTTLNKLGAVMGVSFGLYGAFRGIQEIVKTIAEFDLAQKKLQSVLGETAVGMKEISQSAIDVGKNSIFGAKGVSELQIELAKMGFTKNDIMAMQQAINNLAIATQEDLASSAETVANIIKVYGMSANETTRIVDVMGKAFNDSALGLSNFREGIKYIAPVAKQAGLSFEQTVAGMELLANAGLKGSLTGTAFNNVLKAMMDSNSKLAKQMGGAVSGWDGFVSVLQKARDEGWNMQDVFGLITQRATGAFAILKDGIPTLVEMEQALNDVSGIIANQAEVQMQSLTYSAKRLKEEWKALILEIDSGNGVLSQGLKIVMETGSAILWSLTNNSNNVEEEFNKTLKDLDAAQSYYVDKNDKRNIESINKQVEFIEKLKKAYMSIGATGTTAYPFAQFALKQIADVNQEYIDSLVEAANAEVERFGITSPLQEQFNRQRERGLLLLGLELTQLKRNGQEESFEYKVKVEALEKINKLTYERTTIEETEEEKRRKAHEAYLKRVREKYDAELEFLRLVKEIEDEHIKDRMDSYEELFNLQVNQYTYNVEKAKLEYDLAIKVGENEVNAKKKYNLLLQKYALEHNNKMVEIREKMNNDLKKAEEKLLEDSLKAVDDYSSDYVKAWKKRMKDLDEFMADFKFDNPILAFLTGKRIEEGLFTGEFSEDEVTKMAEAFKTAFDSIGDSITSYADSWVEQTDRIVEQLNRQIDETQSALEVEAELAQSGYANNVTLKKKELEELKKTREQALADQREAQQAQVALDTVTQLSSLVTAAAQIFKSFTKAFPAIGTGLAIGVIATMFGAFAAAKAKANQLAATPKYEKGGWIGGRRHSGGGTMIEAERDEFVVNRNSALKHRQLIEAVNNDDNITLNRLYLNNLKGQIMSHKVSLDDSKDLKAIRELMERGGKSVEYTNGWRIERNGSIVKRVKLAN